MHHARPLPPSASAHPARNELAFPAAASSPGVLIVAESGDTREVLETVLAGHGLRTWVTDEPARALQLARTHHPEVTVLDAETLPAQSPNLSEQIHEATIGEGGSLVVIGSLPRPAASAPGQSYVAKPYHFAPLIRKIEALAEDAAIARGAARARAA